MNNQNIHEAMAFELDKLQNYLKDLVAENDKLRKKLAYEQESCTYWIQSSGYWSEQYFALEKKVDQSEIYNMMRA